MKDSIFDYNQAQEVLSSVKNLKYKSVVSLGDPGTNPPQGYEDFPRSKIRLEFRDSTEGRFLCKKEDIVRLISFLRLREEGPTLFHCRAGVGRSSAACFIKQAIRQTGRSQKHADRALKKLLSIKTAIYPNPRMIQIADSLLGYEGNLENARIRSSGLPIFS